MCEYLTFDFNVYDETDFRLLEVRISGFTHLLVYWSIDDFLLMSRFECRDILDSILFEVIQLLSCDLYLY